MAYRPLFWLACCYIVGVIWAAYGGSLALLLPVYLLIVGYVFLKHKPTSILPANPDRFSGHTTFISIIGANRILCIAGLFLLFCGFYRYIGVEADRANGRARLLAQDEVPYRVICRSMPESQVTQDISGRWRCHAYAYPDEGRAVGVIITGRDPTVIRAGTVLYGQWRVRAVTPRIFPGEFSPASYLLTRGESAELSLVSLSKEKLSSQDDSVWYACRRVLDEIRARMIQTTLRHARATPGAFLVAAIYGYRKGVTPEMRESFQAVGVGHLLAISGLHVGLIVGLAWWSIRRLIADIRVVAFLSIGICLLYLGLCGGRIAALRAAVIALIYLLGVLLGRRSDFINSVGAAALLILLFNPAAVFDLGFQLSFIAVIFIARVHHEVAAHLLAVQDKGIEDRSHRLRLLRVVHLILLSIAAWLGVWPLVGYAFHVMTPVGLLVNPLAIPWMAVVLLGGMLLPLAEALPTFLSPYFASLCELPTALLLDGLGILKYLPGADMSFHPPTPDWLVIYYLGFALFFMRSSRKKNRQGMLAILGILGIVVAATVIILQGFSLPASHPGRIHLIPDRAGEITIIELEERRTLVMGPFGTSQQRRIEEYLRYRGLGPPKEVFAIQSKDASTAPRDFFSTTKITPIVRRDQESAANTWMALPESRYRLYLNRDGEGRLIWWSFTHAGGASVLLTDWMWPEQMRYRIQHNFQGESADVALLRVRGAAEEAALAQKGDWRHAFLSHDTTRLEMDQFHRTKYGVLVLTPVLYSFSVKAYSDPSWVTVIHN